MKLLLKAMGFMLFLSMICTEGLLLMQGRGQEAIPLHLCSLSAICALAAAWGSVCQDVMDYLWYIGLPGAVLALIFPAPAQSAFQWLFSTSYMVTHIMIVLIVAAAMYSGKRPRTGRTAQMMLLLQGIAFTAFLVNEALGTNFLFLHAPPAGSPLVTVYGWGYPAYVLSLEGIMLSLCLVQSIMLSTIVRRGRN